MEGVNKSSSSKQFDSDEEMGKNSNPDQYHHSEILRDERNQNSSKDGLEDESEVEDEEKDDSSMDTNIFQNKKRQTTKISSRSGLFAKTIRTFVWWNLYRFIQDRWGSTKND